MKRSPHHLTQSRVTSPSPSPGAKTPKLTQVQTRSQTPIPRIRASLSAVQPARDRAQGLCVRSAPWHAPHEVLPLKQAPHTVLWEGHHLHTVSCPRVWAPPSKLHLELRMVRRPDTDSWLQCRRGRPQTQISSWETESATWLSLPAPPSVPGPRCHPAGKAGMGELELTTATGKG